MSSHNKAVIFDFDYTLTDSSEGAVRCINYALEKLDLPAASKIASKKTIGLSLKDTFYRLVDTRYRNRVDDFSRYFYVVVPWSPGEIGREVDSCNTFALAKSATRRTPCLR